MGIGISLANGFLKKGGIMNSIIKANGGSKTNKPVIGWVDQMLEDNLSRFFNDDFWGFDNTSLKTNVPVNLKETDKTYEMEIVAPGLRKEDFKLQVSNDLLTLSYEQKQEENKEDKKEGWLRREYRMQSFTRSFNIDDTVDVNKITASYNNGVLYLTLPKKENAQKISKSIEIS